MVARGYHCPIRYAPILSYNRSLVAVLFYVSRRELHSSLLDGGGIAVGLRHFGEGTRRAGCPIADHLHFSLVAARFYLSEKSAPCFCSRGFCFGRLFL